MDEGPNVFGVATSLGSPFQGAVFAGSVVFGGTETQSEGLDLPQKRWDSFNTVHEAKRQQRLNVLGKELLQHRNRLEQARRHAELEKDLDNMLLRGALLAANPHEQDRVVGMLSQTDRVLGEGEIEETQEFQDADNSQRKRPKTTEGKFIDNAQNLRFYSQPSWDDQKQAGGQLRDGAKDLQFHSLLRCDGGGAQEAYGPPLERS